MMVVPVEDARYFMLATNYKEVCGISSTQSTVPSPSFISLASSSSEDFPGTPLTTTTKRDAALN